MALIDQAFKDAVRAQTDIVAVISSYVKLERRGNRFVALCPFHSEKSPSFHVIPDLQIFHCFGCKAGGDVFKFLQERDHLSFYEAVTQLAKRAGIPLPREERTPDEEKTYRERRAIYDALDLAARFFHHELLSEGGEAARSYLLGRGLTAESMDLFRLGWAPGYSRLFHSLRSRFPPDVLQKAGLILPRREGSGYIDAFFDRVIFPITDMTGRVIGFGGRILQGNGPKYKNTAETPLFSKRQVLFGLAQAKEAIRARNQTILVEGYMDVIMPRQVGIDNVVAPLGTALTEEQAQVLRRQAEQVIVAFDSDTAGQLATIRGLERLYESGCDVRILRLPEGKDPDEYIRTHGAEGFRRCIDEAIPLIEFKLRLAMAKDPEDSPEAKAKAVEAVARVLADLPNDVLREEYARRVASELASTPMDVREMKLAIDKQMNRLLRSGFQHNSSNSRNNIRGLGLVLRAEQSPQPVFRSGGAQTASQVQKVTKDDLTWKAERTLITLLLHHPGLLSRVEAELGESPFGDPVHAAIHAAARADGTGTVQQVEGVAGRLVERIADPDVRQVVTEIAATLLISRDWEQEAGHCIEKVKQHRVSRRIEDLNNLIKETEASGKAVAGAVLQELIQLQLQHRKPYKS